MYVCHLIVGIISNINHQVVEDGMAKTPKVPAVPVAENSQAPTSISPQKRRCGTPAKELQVQETYEVPQSVSPRKRGCGTLTEEAPGPIKKIKSLPETSTQVMDIPSSKPTNTPEKPANGASCGEKLARQVNGVTLKVTRTNNSSPKSSEPPADGSLGNQVRYSP